MAIVNEVITEFGFKGSTKPLTNYNAALGQSIKLLGAGAAAAAGAAVAFGAFVLSTTQALDPMIQLSRTTGVSVENMQELGFAASQSGSDMATMQTSISELSKKIGEAAQTGSADFQRLGISIRDSNGEVKSADKVFGELGGRFKALNLSLDEQRSFADKLGIDPSLIQLINTSGAAMDSMREKARALGVVTTDEANAAAALNDSMTALKFGLGSVQNSIAVGFAPQIKEITEGFIDFLASNKDLIKNGITKFGSAVFEIGKALVRLAPLMLGIAAAFGVMQVAAVGFGGIAAVVFSPVVLITAAIVALLFIVDDLIVAFNGGQSVIADFFQSFFGVDIVPVLVAIVDTFNSMIGKIVDLFKSVGSIFSEVFSAAIALVTGDFDGFIEHIIAAFVGAVDFIVLAFKPITDLIGAVTGAIGGGIADLFGFGSDKPEPAIDQQTMLGSSQPEPAIDQQTMLGSSQPEPAIDQQRILAGSGSQTNQNISNSVQQEVSIEIRSNDPKATGIAVNDALNEQLTDTQTQFNRGGA